MSKKKVEGPVSWRSDRQAFSLENAGWVKDVRQRAPTSSLRVYRDSAPAGGYVRLPCGTVLGRRKKGGRVDDTVDSGLAWVPVYSDGWLGKGM